MLKNSLKEHAYLFFYIKKNYLTHEIINFLHLNSLITLTCIMSTRQTLLNQNYVLVPVFLVLFIVEHVLTQLMALLTYGAACSLATLFTGINLFMNINDFFSRFLSEDTSLKPSHLQTRKDRDGER